MKPALIIALITLLTLDLSAQEPDTVGISREYKKFQFPSVIPEDCPFPVSHDLNLIFSGRFANYTNADTWYPSWASNDTLYSPWTDGYLLNVEKYEPFIEGHPGYPCNSLDFMARKAATAQAAIAGSDPLDLKIINLVPRIEGPPAPYEGRYPCGSLVYDNVWYYGTYCLTNSKTSACNNVGWTEMGPFVGFRVSTDFGKTWEECPHAPAQPLFNENPSVQKVRIGSPHFVDFGKNMENSPDGYAYLVAGGSEENSCNNWIQADNVYLLRVKPQLKNMNNAGAYEFFCGMKNGKAQWSSRIGDMKPLLSWKEQLGCVTVSYNPFIKKYLMCITRGNNEDSVKYRSMILISDRLVSDWKILAYWNGFGPVGYFLNFPTKFMTPDSMWLSYSANWDNKNIAGNPAGSHYSFSLHEIILERE
jgi:hypothetical protein